MAETRYMAETRHMARLYAAMHINNETRLMARCYPDVCDLECIERNMTLQTIENTHNMIRRLTRRTLCKPQP